MRIKQSRNAETKESEFLPTTTLTNPLSNSPSELSNSDNRPPEFPELSDNHAWGRAWGPTELVLGSVNLDGVEDAEEPMPSL